MNIENIFALKNEFNVICFKSRMQNLDKLESEVKQNQR